MRMSLFGLMAAAALLTATALSQAPPPPAPPVPPSNLARPTPQEITGQSCRDNDSEVEVHNQDPATLYWSGRAWAHTHCQNTWYTGCADIQWDPTGTTYSLQIVWNAKEDRRLPSPTITTTGPDKTKVPTTLTNGSGLDACFTNPGTIA
jgi:hypothetical protein